MTETRVEEVAEEVKIEEVVEEQENADQAEAPAAEGEEAKGSRQTKSEKKARKQVQKLGLRPVTDITRVTIKKSKNVCAFQQKENEIYEQFFSTYFLGYLRNCKP